jgi:magnesium-transporting ATPase (P-type)
MATFHTAADTSGRPVVRCFVKGAAPAVMGRAAIALAAGKTIPWDAELSQRAQAHMERMEGEGRRVMAAAMRDLDPAAFDPAGDLLGYVTELQMTSLVGMVDPPREESRAAVASAHAMILSDDNFATIVFAVEQGRKLFDNLLKYIRFVLVLLVAFVLTFLGASIFNIAAGEPFNPAQVLWIHFVVNAPFGFALGFDQETPGLMARRPVHEAGPS